MEKDEFLRRAEQFMELVYARGLALGGMISGEHGIGRAKAPYLARPWARPRWPLQRGIKQVFDPKGLLNPGKVC